jgi:hypothetical protein
VLDESLSVPSAPWLCVGADGIVGMVAGRSLWLSGNAFNSTIPAGISGLSRLVYLYLDSSQLFGTLSAGISALNKLRLVGGQLGGAMRHFSHAPAPVLLVHVTQCTTPPHTHTPTLVRLLDMRGNLLVGTVPTSLTACRQLS